MFDGEFPRIDFEIDQNSLILDFNCQPLRRVPICFMSVGPYGPGGVLGNFEGGDGRGVPKVFSRKDPPKECKELTNWHYLC